MFTAQVFPDNNLFSEVCVKSLILQVVNAYM